MYFDKKFSVIFSSLKMTNDIYFFFFFTIITMAKTTTKSLLLAILAMQTSIFRFSLKIICFDTYQSADLQGLLAFIFA